MKIYLNDIIGSNSGVYNYLNSFAKKLHEYNFVVTIESNYNTNGRCFYPNVFTGNKLSKILKLKYSLLKFIYSNLVINKKNKRIVSLYGSHIDFLFILVSIPFKSNIILDLHELIGNDIKNKFTHRFYMFVLSKIRNDTIIHSKKLLNKFKELNSRSKVFYLEHIEYDFNKSYSQINIEKKIFSSINKNYTNLLFFGNLLESKGLNDLIDIIQKHDFNNNKINIIIAGKDSKNIIKKHRSLIEKKCKIITRHINDDEMKFLYSHCNYVILPYKQISQSGVLETAVKYRKPSITSEINYFRTFFKKYPSFGHCVNTTNSDTFIKSILKICSSNSYKYFNSKDLSKFKQSKENNFATFTSGLIDAYNES